MRHNNRHRSHCNLWKKHIIHRGASQTPYLNEFTTKLPCQCGYSQRLVFTDWCVVRWHCQISSCVSVIFNQQFDTVNKEWGKTHWHATQSRIYEPKHFQVEVAMSECRLNFLRSGLFVAGASFINYLNYARASHFALSISRSTQLSLHFSLIWWSVCVCVCAVFAFQGSYKQ